MNTNDTYEKVESIHSLAEHEQIILWFLRTGFLDRDHAIAVYQKFSLEHPDYVALVRAENAIWHNNANITTISNEQIVQNLNKQVFFLSGKSLLEELSNGK